MKDLLSGFHERGAVHSLERECVRVCILDVDSSSPLDVDSSNLNMPAVRQVQTRHHSPRGDGSREADRERARILLSILTGLREKTDLRFSLPAPSPVGGR